MRRRCFSRQGCARPRHSLSSSNRRHRGRRGKGGGAALVQVPQLDSSLPPPLPSLGQPHARVSQQQSTDSGWLDDLGEPPSQSGDCLAASPPTRRRSGHALSSSVLPMSTPLTSGHARCTACPSMMPTRRSSWGKKTSRERSAVGDWGKSRRTQICGAATNGYETTDFCRKVWAAILNKILG